MDELILVLFVLGIILVFITLVGHGLWLLAAALLRALLGGEQVPGRPCHACGNPQGMVRGRCRFCGAVAPAVSEPPWRSDLDATVRQLERLAQRGAISPQQHSQLLAVLRQYREQVSGRVATPEAGSPFQPAADRSAAVEPAVPTQRPAVAGTTRLAPPGVDLAKGSGPPVEAEVVGDATSQDVVELGEVVERRPAPAHPLAPQPPLPHPLSRVEPAAPPARRSRTLANLLQAFMEESNIRWGELVSGLLIVGCAVGLVISLWATLRDAIPYLPALIFMLGTAAIHAAGIYTLRRWNLQSISRAVLIIATLLVPLNFAAAIALSGNETQQFAVLDPRYLIALLVGLAAFGTMTYFASRALMADGWWLLWLAVLGTSAGQLIINRQAALSMSPLHATALMVLPLASFLIAMLWQIQRARRWRRLSPRRSEPIFLLLGVASFSLVVPLGLLLSKAESLERVLAGLAPALSTAAAVVLGTGLLVHRRALSRSLVTLRTTGTAVALFGALLMLLMVVVAWPEPKLLVAVGLVNFAILVSLAILGQLPILHAAAIACFALAYLLSFHLILGSFAGFEDELSRRMVDVVLMGRSSVALTVLATLVAGTSVWLRRSGRVQEALSFVWSCLGLVVLSVLIAAYAGFWPGVDSEAATPVLAFYAICLLAAGLLLPKPQMAAASWIGSGLFLAALVHALAYNPWSVELLAGWSIVAARPVLAAVLMHATAMVVVAMIVWLRRVELKGGAADWPQWRSFVAPLSLSALVTSVLATPFAVVVLREQYGTHGVYTACIAVVWLLIAVIHQSPVLFRAFQAMMSFSLCVVVAAVARRAGWWDGTFWDLQFPPILLGSLGVWCLAWSVFRKLVARWKAAGRLMSADWPAVDQLLLGGVIAGLASLACYACWPGILLELGFVDSLEQATGTVAHEAAYGKTMWIALGVVFVALVSSVWERLSLAALTGLVIASAIAALLIAAPFESANAVASAARWTFAFYAAITAVPICLRRQIARAAQRRGWFEGARIPDTSGDFLRTLALVLGGFPVLVLTTQAVVQVSMGHALGGPIAGTLFSQLGPAVSYATPLAILTITLMAYAICEKAAIFAMLGSLVFQYVVSLACLLPVLSAGRALDEPVVAQLLQWNAIGLGSYALVWLALRRWIQPPDAAAGGSRERGEVLLAVQIAATLAVMVSIAAWASFNVLGWPQRLPAATQDLGHWLSYLALLLAMVASVWYFRDRLSTWGIHVAGILLLVLGGLGAATAAPSSSAQNWFAFHVLSSAWLGVAAVAVALVCFAIVRRALHAAPLSQQENPANGLIGRLRWQSHFARSGQSWAVVALVLVVVAALRGCFDDPLRWWSALTAGVATSLVVALGLISRSRLAAYVSALLAALAITLLWMGVWPTTGLQAAIELVELNLIIVVLIAGVWLAADVWLQRRPQPRFEQRSMFPPVHHIVAVCASAVSLMFFLSGLSLTSLARAMDNSPTDDVSNLCGWIAVACLGMMLLASLWERSAKYAMPCLYVWGLVVVAISLDQLEDQPKMSPAVTVVAMGLAVAGYIALIGHLWKWGANLARLGSRLDVPDPVAVLERTSRWLPAVSLVLAAAVVLIEFVVVLTFEQRWMRNCAGFAPLLLGYGVACLAQQQRRGRMQYLALLLAGLSVVFLGWADIEPSWQDQVVLTRAIRLLMALAVLTFIYGVVVSRILTPASDWLRAVSRAAATCGGASICVLLLVLALETAFFEPRVGAPIDTYQIAAVAVVLVLLVIALLSMALLPHRDPLSLSERGRMLYVYGAQAVAALLFAHVYLSKPALFQGTLRPYWPYIVMAIAFFGVGAGELFHRRGLRVLAEPFQRTGGFLPLLPVLAFWVIGSQNELSYEVNEISYAMVLFVAGLLYVLLSMLRRSIVSGVAAALAGNGALWVLLHDHRLAILQNPQLWLIPPALSALLAAHINRHRLGENQLTAVRYMSVIVIYLSSTGEMFVRGVGESLWPPVLLAGLAVAGVLAGIVMQVRAFLFMGSSFLVLALISMVWHAARSIDHVWPWWAFGIGLGLCILTLFGIFEKKRAEILQLIDRLRQWER